MSEDRPTLDYERKQATSKSLRFGTRLCMIIEAIPLILALILMLDGRLYRLDWDFYNTLGGATTIDGLVTGLACVGISLLPYFPPTDKVVLFVSGACSVLVGVFTPAFMHG